MAVQAFHPAEPMKFVAYAALAMFASTLKVRLPGIKGTRSVSYVMIVLAVVELSLGETVALALLSASVQTYWHAKSRPTSVHVAFNLASSAVLLTYQAGPRESHSGFVMLVWCSP
jgi:hypothetical protein